jgi:hypothetical protein
VSRLVGHEGTDEKGKADDPEFIVRLFIGFTLGFFITGYRVGIYKGDGGE